MLFDTRVRRRFHQSANSCELEGDPRGTDARSSPAFNHRRRGPRKGACRRGWWKPVSYGGRFGASGREDSLSKGEREVPREDELREAQIEGTELRKDGEGPRKIVGERETHERCLCVSTSRKVCEIVRRIESAVIKRAGRSKTDSGDETTKSVQTPEREAPLQWWRRRRAWSKREEETEIATETKVASFGRSSERGAKLRRGRSAREKDVGRAKGVKKGRESERGGNIAKKIDDGKGWQKSCARDERDESLPPPFSLPYTEQRRNSEDGEGGGDGSLAVLDWRTNARETASKGGTSAGATGQGREGAGSARACWVLVRFSRGKRRRGVRAASGWCIIDPSVCGLGKKRSLRLGPRKRRSDIPSAYGSEKETPPRRPISQTDIRNAFASYPACGGIR